MKKVELQNNSCHLFAKLRMSHLCTTDLVSELSGQGGLVADRIFWSVRAGASRTRVAVRTVAFQLDMRRDIPQLLANEVVT